MSEKTIINVASYNRIESLINTINSIYDQCDVINIFLNDHTGEIPEKLLDSKINLFFSDNSYGDALKFAKLMESDGYYLTIDDDLIYPPNYVNYMVSRCKEYSNKRVVTLHGRNFPSFPINSYYNSYRELYHCLKPQRKNVLVQFGGTGVMCFHTDLMKIPIEFFLYPNMSDIWVGKYCIENNIEMICITHPGDFLKYQPQKSTIYDTESKSDSYQTNIVNQIFDPKIENNVDDILIPVQSEPTERPIPIVSKLEKTQSKINYDKVNSIFNKHNHVGVVINKPSNVIIQKPSTNSQMIQKLMGKQKRK
jgi:hypothetical protein